MTQEELDALMGEDVDLDTVDTEEEVTAEESSVPSEDEEHNAEEYKVSATNNWPPPPPTDDNKMVHQLDDVEWVYHNGTGYLFPDSTTVHLSNQEESGKWTNITKQSRAQKELVSKDVFSLWIDHGVRPQGNTGGFDYTSTIPRDVKYQYMVVPVTTVEQMSEDRGIEVLVNNRHIQAVLDQESGLVQAIFYQAGELDITEGVKLVLDSPGAVMLKMSQGQVKEITVADPSRSLASIHLYISGMEDLSIKLPEGAYAGESVNLEL